MIVMLFAPVGALKAQTLAQRRLGTVHWNL